MEIYSIEYAREKIYVSDKTKKKAAVKVNKQIYFLLLL